MSLTAAEVAEIVRLVEQSSFDELSLEIDGLKLSLRRNGAGNVGSVTATGVSAATPVASAVATAFAPATVAPAPAAQAVAAGALDPDTHEVRSPLLGTFYRAPKPGAPPFVALGAAVEADTVVAIIEVMKLMNTVRAGMRGTVTEVLVSDGVLVEYDQPLIRVRKSG